MSSTKVKLAKKALKYLGNISTFNHESKFTAMWKYLVHVSQLDVFKLNHLSTLINIQVTTGTSEVNVSLRDPLTMIFSMFRQLMG